MTRVPRLRRDERGWALLTSVLVLAILMSLSLPLMSLVDGQQRGSANERKSESSFNLAEAAFDATVFALANDWPVLEGAAYPSACTAGSTGTPCPSSDLLANAYAGSDYTARGWSVRVRDDVDGGRFYDPAVVDGQPSWDSNGNAKLWVRADATAAAGGRTVVALVGRQDQLEPFPRNAVTAGWFRVHTGGQKTIVDTKGNAAQPSPVAVRCTTPAPSANCLDYRGGQISPDTVYTGYVGDSAIPPDALERLRARAKALGSYYATGCPHSPAGELVFIENGNCGYAGGASANSAGSPGMLVVATGTVSFSGSMSYYGLVYAANLQGSSGIVISLNGASAVVGALAVDGNGGITVGSNGRNIVYDDRVFPLIKSFGSAAAVQGTWRELPAS